MGEFEVHPSEGEAIAYLDGFSWVFHVFDSLDFLALDYFLIWLLEQNPSF